MTTTVEEKLDVITAQLAELSQTIAAERLERDRWRDLVHELTPIAQSAMTLASEELEDLSSDVTVDDAIRLARTAARAMPQLESLLSQLGSAAELGHEVTSLAGAGMGTLSDALAVAEQRGYFTAGRYAATTVNRMVASISQPVPAATPSAMALVRRLGETEVRRGLARALDLLQALGADPHAASVSTPRATTHASVTHPAKD